MNEPHTTVEPGGGGELQAAIDFLQRNGRILLFVTLLGLAFVLGVTGYKWHVKKTIAQASIDLSGARGIQDLETVVERYAATPSAPMALLRLAKMYYDAGNYDMAASKYEEFEQKFPEHLMADAATLGKTMCREGKAFDSNSAAQLEHVLREFSDFATKHQKHFLTRCFCALSPKG